MARGIFGERLKRERELREVTPEEITSATRIGPRFLEALENEDWDKLPGGIFNRGFVRAIARYLGLDEEAFLAEYDLAHGTQLPPAPERPEERIPSPPRWLPFALAGGAILILAALLAAGRFAWHYYQARKARSNAVSANIAAPTAASLNSVAAPSDAPLDLLVATTSPTHLRILSDGQSVFDSDIRPGELRHFTASGDFEVSADDSGVVLLQLNGQAMPFLGGPGASGTMELTHYDLRQAQGGNSQP